MNPALPHRNWYYVYLLRSSKTQRIYIGCTNDLGNRLKEHNEGNVYSTKRLLPVELIYYEAYISKDTAYKREKNLKSYGSGLAGLKLRLGIKKKGRAG
jgi:putative endonuclease